MLVHAFVLARQAPQEDPRSSGVSPQTGSKAESLEANRSVWQGGWAVELDEAQFLYRFRRHVQSSEGAAVAADNAHNAGRLIFVVKRR